MRQQLPLLLGVVPFGLIFGALAIDAGISPLAAQGFSLFVFAGSAQFIAADLIGGGTPALVTIATIWVVNLRHLLYSATLSPIASHLQARWRWPLAWLLTDEAFATTSVYVRQPAPVHPQWYWLGTGLTLWSSWQVSTAIGISLGATLPPAWNLEFTLPLTFIALLLPSLRDRPTWAAAIVGGLAALLLAWLPYRLGLLLGALAGIGAGLLVDETEP